MPNMSMEAVAVARAIKKGKSTETKTNCAMAKVYFNIPWE